MKLENPATAAVAVTRSLLTSEIIVNEVFLVKPQVVGKEDRGTTAILTFLAVHIRRNVVTLGPVCQVAEASASSLREHLCL